jgi:selenophosphate synthase
MAIPDLAVIPGGHLISQSTGVPVNGANAFLIPYVDAGIDPAEITADNLVVDVLRDSASSSVTDAVPGTPFLSADKRTMTLDIVQGGGDAVTVRCQLLSSLVR